MKSYIDKEQLFQFFKENDGKQNSAVISQAAEKFNIKRSTTEQYYYDWRREYMKVPPTTKEELRKEVEEHHEKYSHKRKNEVPAAVETNTEDTTKDDTIAPELVCEESKSQPVIGTIENDCMEEYTASIEEAQTLQTGSIAAAPILNIRPRLRPILMSGEYATYNFSEKGVSRMSASDLITSDSIKEDLEALSQWERYYKEVV